MVPLYDENHHDTVPWGCYTIMAICTALMLLEHNFNDIGIARFMDAFALIPAQFFGNAPRLTEFPEKFTLISSAFLHADWFHLLGNMVFLWLFADNIEHAFGHVRFVIFYLFSCIATALCFAMLHADTTLPLVGASGAISAAMGAYLVLYPKAQVTVFISLWIPTVEVRAWILMIYWFLLDIAGTLNKSGDSNIAYEAHIAGFIIGAILGRMLRQNMSSYDDVWDGMTRIERPIPRNKWERFLQHEKEMSKYND